MREDLLALRRHAEEEPDRHGTLQRRTADGASSGARVRPGFRRSHTLFR